jgi:hypothetical protein
VHVSRDSRPPALEALAVAGLLVLVGVGAAARLFGVDRSLWLDEFSTLWCIQAGPAAIASRVASFQGQSPFYYSSVWVATQLLGETEVALRAPSLLASALTSVLCAGVALSLGGRRAAVWALLMSWLAFPQVQIGVNARPYAMAVAGTALMLFGYVRAVEAGALRFRLLFIAGICLQFWAHFILVLPLVGLAAAHLWRRPLRTRYPGPAFALDLLVAGAACAPAWPYLLAAVGRTHHVTWLAAPRHADIAVMLVPFVLPVCLELARHSRRRSSTEEAVLLSGLGVIVVLELALVMHINLVTSRYLGPIVVSAAISSALALARLSRAERVIALVAFLTITCASYGRTWVATGTFSGIGVEDWKSATALARTRLEDGSVKLVLFRSGFVEEDLPPLGSPHPATLASLRGPGEDPLPADVISLTHTWSAPGREAYFDRSVSPRLDRADAFLIVVQRTTENGQTYTDRLERWLQSRPGADLDIRDLRAFRGVDIRVVRKRALRQPLP